MSLILPCERRAWKVRLLVGLMYLLLAVGAVTMVYPFLITVASSLTNASEYSRFRVWPRSFYDRGERFVRNLVTYWSYRPSALVFPGTPPAWATWAAVGENPDQVRAFAAPYLAVADDPARLAQWRRAAADFAEFNLDYDIRDTTCNYDRRDLAGFLTRYYEARLRAREPGFGQRSAGDRRARAIAELRADWGIPFRSFFDIELRAEREYPMHHRTWDHPATAQARLYLEFKDAYRRLEFRPGAERQWRAFARERGVAPGEIAWPVRRGDSHGALFREFVAATAPASSTLPFLLKEQWLAFFDRPEARRLLDRAGAVPYTVADYNRRFGTGYARLADIPFPVPGDAGPELRKLWDVFVMQDYPRRLMSLRVTPELQTRYQARLRATYRTIAAYNTLANTNLADFADIPLRPYENGGDWREFADTLAAGDFDLRSAEAAYQTFLREKYGTVEAVNAAYGWRLGRLEEAIPPVAEAIVVTFLRNEWRDFFHESFKNYAAVVEFMALRGRAFLNTVLFIAITLMLSLTINPLAAYALSRFRLRWTEQILLFALATMAFPAAVTAVPSFLLLRDLRLLNTLYALFLPGVANGMSIFILKCFFDGLPRELYEAATIDGANELQIFAHISLPMITPILAVNALNAFIAAYNSWEWALLVCQKESYWTIAVWLYQLAQTVTETPWIVMAAFVTASIPTALVFITCQKVILRGIVVPSMK